jgi:inosine-uridine nucleoside N-ribohydrolase
MKRIALYFKSVLLVSFFFLGSTAGFGQDEYAETVKFLKTYDFKQRTAPKIPPKDQQIRVIIDSDAKNEVDDQWAIALALLYPERLIIEGFVASNYAHASVGTSGIQKSYDEINLILEKAGFEGKYPVYRGSHPMRYAYEASESEGVDFIIKKAMEATPEDPLWVVALGTATNLASAILKEPKIIDRVIFFWHGRTQWPNRCVNFNVFGDMHAARLLFHYPVSFVLFDTGTHLYCPMDESEKMVRPYGEIGEYLHEIRKINTVFTLPTKGFFDLGDIAALIDPDIAYWEEVQSPYVDLHLNYKFTNSKGRITRCFHVDRGKTFQLLYDRLIEYYGNK